MTTKKTTLITVLLLLLMAGGTLYHYQTIYLPDREELDGRFLNISTKEKLRKEAMKEKDTILPELKKQWDTLSNLYAQYNKMEIRTLKATSVRYLNDAQVQRAATYLEALLDKHGIRYQTYKHTETVNKSPDREAFQQDIYKFNYIFSCKLVNYLWFSQSLEKAMKGEGETVPLPIRFSELNIQDIPVRSDRKRIEENDDDVVVDLTLEALYRPFEKECEITWEPLPEAEKPKNAEHIISLANNQDYFVQVAGTDLDQEQDPNKPKPGEVVVKISTIIELPGQVPQTKVVLTSGKERLVFGENEPAKQLGGNQVRLVKVIRRNNTPIGVTIEALTAKSKQPEIKDIYLNGTNKAPENTPSIVQAEGAPAPEAPAPDSNDAPKDDATDKPVEQPTTQDKTEEENK